jgi:anti-sigma factor RsiW
VAARYGAGPGITPHLYWRAGGLLYTVSGPFPKGDLVAIAESLAPLAS